MGQSVRFLRGQRGLLRRFLGPRTYTPVSSCWSRWPCPLPSRPPRSAGIHVYTFNELKKTETWRRQLVDRLKNQEEDPLAQVNEHPEILLYSRLRKSPYFYVTPAWHRDVQRLQPHVPPAVLRGSVEEYRHLLNGVTPDVGAERQIEISGPDAFEFTNLLVARDLNKCVVEQYKYVFRLPDGGIINDPVLLRLEENRFWLCLPTVTWSCGQRRGLQVGPRRDDQGDRRGPVQVQGPKSKDVMVDLFGDSILEIPYYVLAPLRARWNEGARLADSLQRPSSDSRSTCTRPARTGSSSGTPCSRRASRTGSR